MAQLIGTAHYRAKKYGRRTGVFPLLKQEEFLFLIYSHCLTKRRKASGGLFSHLFKKKLPPLRGDFPKSELEKKLGCGVALRGKRGKNKWAN